MARWLGWTHPKLPPVDLSPSCRCLSRLPCSECKAWGAHCQRTSILSPYLHSEAVAHKGDQRSPMSGRYTAPSPWGRICFSSEQCLSLHCFPAKKNQGEVLEWLKRHAWKVCKRQKRFAGSNPALRNKGCKSATYAIYTLFYTQKYRWLIRRQAEPLELLDGASRARLVFSHLPDTSSPFPGYSDVLISPIHLQCQSHSRRCLKTLEDS